MVFLNGKMVKTRSIRLTEEAIGLLYKMAGVYQTASKKFVSPSKAIELLHWEVEQHKVNGVYPVPTEM